MHVAAQLWSPGEGGKAAYRDGARVARKDRVLLRVLAERGEHPFLDVEVLDDSLDYEVGGTRGAGQVFLRGDVTKDFGGNLLRQASLLYGPLEQPGVLRHGPFELALG